MKLLNTESTYKMLQPFEKIEQVNANTRAIREQFADKLSPATRQVLDVLHRYASKYYGVCFLSKSKIADKLGVSKRTVIRACQRLEELGVIAQYPLYRHNGDRRQSSNAIVFVAQIEAKEAFVEQSESNVTPECHPKDAPLNAHLENINNTLDTEKADRKSTRLNSSHVRISYAVFCLKKKKKKKKKQREKKTKKEKEETQYYTQNRREQR